MADGECPNVTSQADTNELDFTSSCLLLISVSMPLGRVPATGKLARKVPVVALKAGHFRNISILGLMWTK
jgi:hypothetical protein